MATKTEKDLWVEMSIIEISTQADFAKIAFSNIDPKAVSNNRAVFSSIHSFLSHCAIISKMLKAVDDSIPPKSIGDVLGVSAQSIVHKRKFRNCLEHYNDELKTWIKKYGTNAVIGLNNIGPKSALQIPGMVYVSHYDDSMQTFTFVNEDFNLGIMMSEVEKIKNIADGWLNDIRSRKINPPFI